MFRMTDGLMSALRTLGAVLLICGLGMMFTSPASADDPSSTFVPINCSDCTPQMPPSGCQSNGGCYCPPHDDTFCQSKTGYPNQCACEE